MELLEQTSVSVHGRDHGIELYLGDLARLSPDHEVDAVVVSAFPDRYAPTPGTLIAALDNRGLVVGELAQDKADDLRTTSSCWISRPIANATLGFRHLICFEPAYRVNDEPAMVVGDLFRSLVPFSTAEPWVRRVAMPILAAGKQRQSPVRMLNAIVETSMHWLASGLDLDSIKIVIYDRTDPDLVAELRETFRSAAARAASEGAAKIDATTSPHDQDYDVFLSYSRRDTDAVERLLSALHRIDPALRVFLDREELDSGSAWQQRIYDAIDRSKHVICLYSPDYLSSKVCIEELHIGWLRHREAGGGVLIPAYLRSTDLPSYLRLVQYSDVRESDDRLLDDFAQSVVDRVRETPKQNRSSPLHELGDLDVQIGSDSTPTTVDLAQLLAQLTRGGEIELDVRIRLKRPPA